MIELLDMRLVFLVMVFTAGFLLVQSLVAPVFGENRRLRRQLRRRLDSIAGSPERVQLARKDGSLPESKLVRRLELAPLLRGLREAMSQAGWKTPAYRLVLLAAGLGLIGLFAGLLLRSSPLLGGALAVLGAAAPFLRLQHVRRKRLMLFDAQLPEALDVTVRALRAGHPFKETLRLVGDELSDPIASEFHTTFNDVNYGGDLREALYDLARRVPSVNVTAMVTAILIQKETGGNLSEVMEKLASIIRGRFRFHRKTKTLSAEARLSAWILTLVPFVLFIVISIVHPHYLPMLTENEQGQHIVATAFVFMIVGILWMRKIIRIDV